MIGSAPGAEFCQLIDLFSFFIFEIGIRIIDVFSFLIFCFQVLADHCDPSS